MSVGTVGPSAAAEPPKGTTWPDWIRLTAGSLGASFWIGASILSGLLLASFIVPALSPYGVEEANPADALQGPGSDHFFGTDSSGLDVFVRTMHAPRLDFPIAAGGVALGLVVGVVLGVTAGMSRGLFGSLTLRVVDLVQAFPLFVLAISLVALTGNDITNLVWVLGFVSVPVFLRLARSRVLTIRELRYVEAGIALGNTRRRLIFKHVLPNAMGPVVVQAGLSMGYAVLTIAAMAFLGVGIQVPTPEWGSMILIGARDTTTGQWWTAVFPGLVLALAVAGFNLVADGIEGARDVHR